MEHKFTNDVIETENRRAEKMTIENWGFKSENEVMKGYVLYALNEIEKNEPELALSDEQRKALFNGLRWATSDMTAEEAYNYYVKN